MKRRLFGVGIVLLLALGVFTSTAEAQQSGDPKGKPIVRQNYPNPFNPETRIPFSLPEELFKGGRPVVVTMRIYNQLHEQITIPQALNHPSGNGVRIEKLEYTTPGDHVAYWDGKDKYGNKVASGLYILRLEVNGERSQPIRMIVAN